jgi:hypothetical protein
MTLLYLRILTEYCIWQSDQWTSFINWWKCLENLRMHWIHLAQDRDQWQAPVNTIVNLQVPWTAGNFLSGWATVCLLSTQLGGVRYWIGKDVVGSDHDLIWRKTQYVRMLSHQAEVRTHDIPDTKDSVPLNCDTRKTSCSHRCRCNSTRG